MKRFVFLILSMILLLTTAQMTLALPKGEITLNYTNGDYDEDGDKADLDSFTLQGFGYINRFKVSASYGKGDFFVPSFWDLEEGKYNYKPWDIALGYNVYESDNQIIDINLVYRKIDIDYATFKGFLLGCDWTYLINDKWSTFTQLQYGWNGDEFYSGNDFDIIKNLSAALLVKYKFAPNWMLNFGYKYIKITDNFDTDDGDKYMFKFKQPTIGVSYSF